MRTSIKIVIAVILLFLFILFPLSADILNSPTWGYSIDLPEGFILVDRQGNDRYLFEHEELPVSVILAAYAEGRYDCAYTALETSLTSLCADYDITETDWRNTDCAVGNFDFQLDGELQTGWSVAAGLPEKGGHIVVLSWCTETRSAELSQFVISCVDALCIDRGSWYEAGPVTAFAYPAEGRVQQSVIISGKSISFTLDASDIDADTFVVEREYAVLLKYQTSERWVEAWQRYYRQIYRNEYGRLKQAAFAIRNALGVNKNMRELAQPLADWAQGLSYTRAGNAAEADFTPVTAIFSEEGSDCDSRSMLLAILLEQMGADTCLFVSAEYGHAMFGICDESIAGYGFELNGKKYVAGETTNMNPDKNAPLTIGLVASSMADSDNWIKIQLSVCGN